MDLDKFRQKVRQRIAAANAEPKWTAEAAARYMGEFAPRRKRFIEIAERLVASVIEPRGALVAAAFANAQADRNALKDRATWWFGYCERFPVTARLEIGVTHDEKIEELHLRYELDLMPTFFKYDAHDKLALPLDAVDEEVAAGWVEQKLFDFLGTYLAIDRGRDDFDDESVTDPVCGMRISRSSAAGSSDYKGHPYFFCSAACRVQFEAAPEEYVIVRI